MVHIYNMKWDMYEMLVSTERGKEGEERERRRETERQREEGEEGEIGRGHISNQQSIPACASMKPCLEASGKDAIYLWTVQLGFPFKSLSRLIIY